MPKMLFLSQEMCGAMGTPQRERLLLRRGNSGWIEWKMRVACVTLAPSQSGGTGSGQGSWEDTSPSLSVSIK